MCSLKYKFLLWSVDKLPFSEVVRRRVSVSKIALLIACWTEVSTSMFPFDSKRLGTVQYIMNFLNYIMDGNLGYMQDCSHLKKYKSQFMLKSFNIHTFTTRVSSLCEDSSSVSVMIEFLKSFVVWVLCFLVLRGKICKHAGFILTASKRTPYNFMPS